MKDDVEVWRVESGVNDDVGKQNGRAQRLRGGCL